MLSPDTVLQSRYRIVRKLSAGGMGTVYEAIDLRFNSQVALKETHFTEEALRKQFEREAHLLYKLRHPAIARVIDHFVEGEGQFLVMDYVEGEDLWEKLEQKGGAFPIEGVLKWADQLLDALDYLHSQDPPIIHRDIKPQNLKLASRNQIILLDFGLAKGFAGQISRVTTSGSIFGYTPSYAPLEQIHGTGTDARSDLYSLAATLYHLLTGKTPPDALSRAMASANEQPDPLRPANEVNGLVTSAIADVLQRAMATNPAKRPDTAAAMREMLRMASQRPTLANGDFKERPLPPTLVMTTPTKEAEEQTAQSLHPNHAQTFDDRQPVAATSLNSAATVMSPTALSGSYSQPEYTTEVPRPFVRFERPVKKSNRFSWLIGGIAMLLVVAASIVYIVNRNSTDSNFLGAKEQSANEGKNLSKPANPEAAAAQLAKEGESLYKQSKYLEAEAKVREAIKLDPNNPEWRDDLRMLLAVQGKVEAKEVAKEAEGLLREALRSDPNNAKLHLFLSGALLSQNKLKEAEQEGREAIRLDPNDAEAHYNLSVTLRFQDRPEEAEAEVREAVRLDPNDLKSHLLLTVHLFEQRKFEEAEKSIREAIRLAPSYTFAREFLGNILIELDRPAEAEDEFREAIRLTPTIAAHHASLGNFLRGRGRLKEAEAAYQEAIKLDPSDNFYKEALQQLQDEMKK
jgi:serine/threonine protein kinase